MLLFRRDAGVVTVTRRGILFVDDQGLVLLCETMKLSRPPKPGRGQIVVFELDYSGVPLRTREGSRWSWSDTVEVRGVIEGDHLRALHPAALVQGP